MFKLTKPNKGNIFFPLLLTFTALGILILLFLREKDAIFEFEWQFKIIPLLGSFVVFSINLILMSLVWFKIMTYLGYTNSPKVHLKVYLISNFLKRIPGTIWYVIGRAKLYETSAIPKRLTTIASGIEFAMLILSSFAVGLIFLLNKFLEQQKLFWIAIIIFIIGLIVVNPKTIEWLFVRTKLEAKTPNYITLIEWFLVYFLVWIGNGIILFLILNIITDLDIRNLFFLIGSVAFVNLISSALFFAPSNLGVSHIKPIAFLNSSIINISNCGYSFKSITDVF